MEAHNSQTLTSKKIRMSLAGISVAMFLLFTAYEGLEILQSSLNSEGNIGVLSLSVVYGTFLVSSLLIAQPLVNALGSKVTIAVCQWGYIAWVAANAFPEPILLLVSSLVVGIVAGPLWIAIRCYISLLAKDYAILKSKDVHTTSAKFFGFSTAVSVLRLFCSSAISLLIFQSDDSSDSNPNVTCGASCTPDWERMSNSSSNGLITDTTLYILVGVYTGVAMLSFLIILLCTRSVDDKIKSSCADLPSSLIAIFKHTLNKEQLLLIPFTLAIEWMKSIFKSDYVKWFVVCPLGIKWLPYVTAVYAVFEITSSMSSGWLIQRFGWRVTFNTAMVLEIGFLCVSLVWVPSVDEWWLSFLVPSMHGLYTGTVNSLIPAFVGAVFPNKLSVALVQQQMWMTLGAVLSFVTSALMCFAVKLYVTIALFSVSFVGLNIELVVMRRRQEKERKGDILLQDQTNAEKNSENT
ncbi:hypothetical protein CAPTEDRAFT_196989 [Capitella teleta]|uniref:Major facilitator superfamily associated domain-containing protein n=1 Tax=Capitella teleta TaxID=283909 RepID=R7TB80_CAPTE|nr:hypothetical protein CAPTEDRAFT_196989 [Capitella teleta]|eukprot:ELT90998.1 hypothetical protein CAPTEDRAFT_196989 [Capitella teleta]